MQAEFDTLLAMPTAEIVTEVKKTLVAHTEKSYRQYYSLVFAAVSLPESLVSIVAEYAVAHLHTHNTIRRNPEVCTYTLFEATITIPIPRIVTDITRREYALLVISLRRGYGDRLCRIHIWYHHNPSNKLQCAAPCEPDSVAINALLEPYLHA